MARDIQSIEAEISQENNELSIELSSQNKNSMIGVVCAVLLVVTIAVIQSPIALIFAIPAIVIGLINFVKGMSRGSSIQTHKDKIGKLQREVMEARAAHTIHKEIIPSSQDSPDEKKCPMCAETIKAAAKVCKHCKHVLS